jgi:hypothetical protein
LLEDATPGLTLAVDSALAGADQPDRIVADRPDTGRFSFEEVRLTSIGAVAPRDSHGVWIGLLHVGADGVEWLRAAIDAARADGTLPRASLADLLARVLGAGHRIRVVYGRGGWANVNDLAGLIDASSI